MSIFSKPLAQLTTSDLQELLQEQAVENLRLEFKSQIPDKDESLKKLTSLANTYGGFVVIGAQARSVDGRIEDLPGVGVQPGYKQKIVQWCFDAVSPPLYVEVSDAVPTPAGNGNFCYVLYIAESDVSPHFLNGRKGVWVRTNEFSARFEARLANEIDLRQLFDRRKLVLDRRSYILSRARARFDAYIAKSHTDRGGSRVHSGPVMEFAIVPRFPSNPLCHAVSLKQFIQKSWTRWRESAFTDTGSPMISQHESIIVPNATKDASLFEVNVWGLLYYGNLIGENQSGTRGIHSYQVVGLILLFVAHANSMLKHMGYSGPLLIETSFASVKDVPWLQGTGFGAGVSSRPGSEFDDQFALSASTTTDELRQTPDRIAIEVVRSIFLSVNRYEMVDSIEKVEELIRMGYQYNSWERPQTLRV